MIEFTIVAIVIVLAALAAWYGVDSREGASDPRSPLYPVGIH